MTMKRVALSLSEVDIKRAERVSHRMSQGGKASAVRWCLALGDLVAEAMVQRPGTDLLLRYPDRSMEVILLPEARR